MATLSGTGPGRQQQAYRRRARARALPVVTPTYRNCILGAQAPRSGGSSPTEALSARRSSRGRSRRARPVAPSLAQRRCARASDRRPRSESTGSPLISTSRRVVSLVVIGRVSSVATRARSRAVGRTRRARAAAATPAPRPRGTGARWSTGRPTRGTLRARGPRA